MDVFNLALQVVGTLLTILVSLWAVMRFFFAKIDSLHHRINDLREKVSSEFVRRDDLMLHVGHIETTVGDLKQENTRQHEALAKALQTQAEAMRAGLDRMHERMDLFITRDQHREPPCGPSTK